MGTVHVPTQPSMSLEADERGLRVVGVQTEAASDGFHTFGELYDQRAFLLALLTSVSGQPVWRSRQHDDGTMFPGMFWLGTETPGGYGSPRPVTFHLDDKHWGLFGHAVTLEKTWPWDGRTPDDVQEAIREWIEWVANRKRLNRTPMGIFDGGPL